MDATTTVNVAELLAKLNPPTTKPAGQEGANLPTSTAPTGGEAGANLTRKPKGSRGGKSVSPRELKRREAAKKEAIENYRAARVKAHRDQRTERSRRRTELMAYRELKRRAAEGSAVTTVPEFLVGFRKDVTVPSLARPEWMPKASYRWLWKQIRNVIKGDKEPRNWNEWWAKIARTLRTDAAVQKLPSGFDLKLVKDAYEKAKRRRRVRYGCTRDEEKIAAEAEGKKNAIVQALGENVKSVVKSLVDVAPAYGRVPNHMDIVIDCAEKHEAASLTLRNNYREYAHLRVPPKWWATVYSRGLALVNSMVIVEAGEENGENVPVRYLACAATPERPNWGVWAIRWGVVRRYPDGRLKLFPNDDANTAARAFELLARASDLDAL